MEWKLFLGLVEINGRDPCFSFVCVSFLDSIQNFMEGGQDIKQKNPVNSPIFMYLCVLSIVCFC